MRRKRLEYLVQWEEFPDHPTWEPKANLKNAADLILQFKALKNAQQVTSE